MAQQRKIKAKGTRGFSATAAEGVVIFSIKTTTKTEHFEFSVDVLPEIVARMIASHAEAAQKEGRLPHAIVAQATVVAIDERTKRVTLSLMPTEQLHVPFSMTTSLASKTAESLKKAVSTLEPLAAKKPH